MLALPIIQNNRVQIRNLLTGRITASLERSDAIDVAGDGYYVVVVYRDGSARRYLAHGLRELGLLSPHDVLKCHVTDGLVMLYRKIKSIDVFNIGNGSFVTRF